jgi:cytoskeleton protein RodZ
MPINLEKIGKFLKEQREVQQLSIADISESLCLRKSLITAIESGNWSLLPHEVYVKGYLKEYAHLLNAYDEILNDLVHEEIKVHVEIPIQQRIKVKHSHSSTRVLVYPLVFVLLIGFVILSQLYKDQPSATRVQQNTAPASVNTSGNNNSEKQQASEIYDVKKLMITCQERTWVSVVIDDTEKKEFMLNPQDIVVLNAKDRYDLLIGNAAGVKLILNGNDVQFTGQRGEVKRIKLS